MFESWMYKLVSAVMQRETEANVVVVDWLPMAQQLYPDAVNHTHTVGLDIAAMLNWLQVCARAIAPELLEVQMKPPLADFRHGAAAN